MLSVVIITLLRLLMDHFLLIRMCSLVRDYIQIVIGSFLILFKLVLGVVVVHIVTLYLSILVHVVFQAWRWTHLPLIAIFIEGLRFRCFCTFNHSHVESEFCVMKALFLKVKDLGTLRLLALLLFLYFIDILISFTSAAEWGCCSELTANFVVLFIQGRVGCARWLFESLNLHGAVYQGLFFHALIILELAVSVTLFQISWRRWTLFLVDFWFWPFDLIPYFLVVANRRNSQLWVMQYDIRALQTRNLLGRIKLLPLLVYLRIQL